MRSFKDIVNIPETDDSGSVCHPRVFYHPDEVIRYVSAKAGSDRARAMSRPDWKHERDAMLDTILMESLLEGSENVDQLFGLDSWSALARMVRKLRPHVRVCKAAHSVHYAKGGDDDWDWDPDYGCS